MNLSDCDVLVKGKQADLIMIDLHQPNMQPIHNIRKNLVYSGSKQNVKIDKWSQERFCMKMANSLLEQMRLTFIEKANEITQRIMSEIL